jgi:hypothetical protein
MAGDAVRTRCMTGAGKGMYGDLGFMRDKFMEGYVREPYPPQA